MNNSETTVFGPGLAELARDYYERRLDRQEYRARRKVILDRMDSVLNNADVRVDAPNATFDSPEEPGMPQSAEGSSVEEGDPVVPPEETAAHDDAPPSSDDDEWEDRPAE